MTDKEIIKALELCAEAIRDASCTDCPYGKQEDGCIVSLCRDSLDLINRQKAEIEFLSKTITDNAQMALEVTLEEIKTARAEAVKEFAERLKGHSNGEFVFTTVKLVENLIKEMVGDNNG